MRRLLTAVLASTVLLSACGSDDEGGGDAPPERVAAEGAVQIDMVDLQFEPSDARARVGQTITWVNRDSVPHNAVNVREGRQPRSDLFNEGETYSWTPTEAGRIAYVCTIHPGMEGTIEVTPAG